MNVIPEFDIVVDIDNPRHSILALVKEVRPQWTAEQVKIKDMSTGYINKNVKVYVENNSSHSINDAIFIQIFNILFDKQFSIPKHIAQFIHDNNIGAKFPCFFKNGLCQEFVPGENMSWEERARQYENRIWQGTAKAMAHFHSKKVYEKALEWGLRDMTLNDPPKHRTRHFDLFKTRDDLPKSIREKIPSSDEFIQARRWYLSLMEDIGAEKVVAHMDVNPTNILIQNDQAILIDYDIVGINYAAADIAWHFLCYGDLRNIDLSDYPKDKHQRKWLTHYLICRREFDKDTRPVSDEDVIEMKKTVDLARLQAFIQATAATVIINGFNKELGNERSSFAPPSAVVSWTAFKQLQEEIQKNPPSLNK